MFFSHERDVNIGEHEWKLNEWNKTKSYWFVVNQK